MNKLLIALIALSSLTIFSCKKETIQPVKQTTINKDSIVKEFKIYKMSWQQSIDGSPYTSGTTNYFDKSGIILNSNGSGYINIEFYKNKIDKYKILKWNIKSYPGEPEEYTFIIKTDSIDIDHYYNSIDTFTFKYDHPILKTDITIDHKASMYGDYRNIMVKSIIEYYIK